jgi:glucose repression regulatory protein TUP1
MIRIWDLQTGHLLERFVGHSNSVYSVSFSPNGKSLVSGSLDKTLKVWDLSPSILAYFENPSADASSKPTTLVTRTWRHSYAGHGDFVLSVAYPGSIWSKQVPGHEIDWVVSGSKDRTVTFWNGSPKDPKEVQSFAQFVLQGHKNSVISIALAPKATIFATGSGDMKAKIWKFGGMGETKAKPIAASPMPPVAVPPSDSQPMIGIEKT